MKASIEKPDIKHINKVFESQKAQALELRSEPINQRKKKLKKLQHWIKNNRSAIQIAINKDFSKPATETDITEIYPTLTLLNHALKNIEQWSQPKKVDAPITFMGTTSYIQYEPKGTALIISPWNYPLFLAVEPLVSALAAGNTAILKPSEISGYTSDLIDTMIGELFPEDEVAVFKGGVETSEELLKLPFDHIFFTGSPTVGKAVMKAAAENLSSVTLELGGKSPTIIDHTAHINDAAEKIAWAKFMNNGQTCVAPDYIIIHSSVKDAFIEALQLQIQLLFDKQLAGIKKSEDYARIINENHFDRLDQMLREALDKGASLAIGSASNKSDRFFPPTVITDVPLNARIMEEEIFGPILPVLTYEKIEEVINLVNSKPKPLALYYFTRDSKNRDKILKETSSGTACINECVIQCSHVNLPFGGVNSSGIGKAHGHHGFMAFSNEKSVLRQRVGFTSLKSLYPPYTGPVKKIINALIKYF